MDAYNSPGFYRQVGKDSDRLTEEALELLSKKFGLG